MNASDFDRYFRAPVDAAVRRKEKNAAQLRSVARGWSAPQSCCFNSLLLAGRVTSSVGTKSQRAPFATYMCDSGVHTRAWWMPCLDRLQPPNKDAGKEGLRSL